MADAAAKKQAQSERAQAQRYFAATAECNLVPEAWEELSAAMDQLKAKEIKLSAFNRLALGLFRQESEGERHRLVDALSKVLPAKARARFHALASASDEVFASGAEDDPSLQELATPRSIVDGVGLYLGSSQTLQTPEGLRDAKLTHALAVGFEGLLAPLRTKEGKVLMGMSLKSVEVMDMEQSDILQHLDECIEFIQGCLSRGGRVMVYCWAGVSRSVAVLAAYLIAAGHASSVDAALALVRSRRASAEPNPAFEQQLRWWAALRGGRGSAYTDARLRYRMLRVELMRGELGHLAMNVAEQGEEGNAADAACFYRCRSCRTRLFSSNNVLEHAQCGGEVAFSWRKRAHAQNALAGFEQGSGEQAQFAPGEEAAQFIPAETWGGARAEYVFKLGPAGQG